MQASYIGFDGAEYKAQFVAANKKLCGKVSMGVLRVTRNGVMVSENITTQRKAVEFFDQTKAVQ
jgi:hypothetical protein